MVALRAASFDDGRRYAPCWRSSTTASRPSWCEGAGRVLTGRIAFERLVGRISSS